MNIIEKLKKEKTKWENRIYGVGETRIDLMIEDVIRELQKYQNELEKKDKVINELSVYVNSPLRIPEEKYCEFYNSDEDCCWKTDKECKDCIKEYFTNKAENVGE